MSQTVEVLEGTWEEIAAHADELKGHRLQLLVFPAVANSANGPNGDARKTENKADGETLAEAFARIGTVSFDPGPGAARVKEVWGEYVEEKHRKGNL